MNGGETDSETGSILASMSHAEIVAKVTEWPTTQRFWVRFSSGDLRDVTWSGLVKKKVKRGGMGLDNHDIVGVEVRYDEAPGKKFCLPPADGVVIHDMDVGRPSVPRPNAPPLPHAQPVGNKAPEVWPEMKEQEIFGRILRALEATAKAHTDGVIGKIDTQAKREPKKPPTIFVEPGEWAPFMFGETGEAMTDRATAVTLVAVQLSEFYSVPRSRWRQHAMDIVKEELDALYRAGPAGFHDEYRMENARRALWRLRAVVEIEDKKLGSTADTPQGRIARNGQLVKLMAIFDSEVAVGKDALEIAVAKAVGAQKPVEHKGTDGGSKRSCYTCGKKGHMSPECPMKTQQQQPQQPGNVGGVQRK
jgi:hypothetical protein